MVSGRGRQIALPIRRKSTCLRATSIGSAAPSVTDSCSDLRAAGLTWPVRSGTCSPRRPGAMAAMLKPNRAAIAAIPPGRCLPARSPGPAYPRLTARSAPSALPDPAEARFGTRLRLPVLAVAPGPAGAFLMVLLTARRADHASIVPCRAVSAPRALRRLPLFNDRFGGASSGWKVRPRSPGASGVAAQPSARPR